VRVGLHCRAGRHKPRCQLLGLPLGLPRCQLLGLPLGQSLGQS
jgi:hypothetical protein